MQRRTGFLGGLRPEIVRLGLVSFFADVSSEMLYPIMPIFLATVLHAPVAAIGLIEGIAEAVASLLKSVFGRISDRTGRRRPFVLAGYTIAALSKPLIALARSWPLVLVARASDRFGKGMRTSPRDALLADFTPPAERARAFGWHRAMDTAGAVVGPLLALALISATRDDLRLVIVLSAIPGLVGAALVLTVRDSRVAAGAASGPRAPPAIPLRRMPRPFLAYLAAWAPFAVANSSDVFLILRARQLGYGTTATVLLYTTYNAVYSLSSPVFGQLADRWGRRQVLVGGLGVFALVYLGFALVRAPATLWALFGVYGLYIAATDGVGKAYAVELVPESVRATAVGMLGTVTGLATLVASTTAGLLWEAVGPWAAFAFGAAGALVSAAGLLLVPSLRRGSAATSL
ncbi:MFS transporter [Anaeromyxobacter oryzae]|uniref:MFS transporter n=1 Tax=Anaeromyxobacter oryzae TaxID=2918170 RepID=UPI0020C0AC8D|nr:MFS transporter [Anaeromyxobacter oryzae]